MKNLLLLGLIICTLSACNKSNIEIKENDNSLLLLKIDYLTYKFEGGYEIKLSATEQSDTIPVKVAYLPPGDFGNISLYYKPSNQLFFNGDIIWMGRGEIKTPANFERPDSYTKLSIPIAQPSDGQFQNIFNEWNFNKQAEIWEAVNNLEIVSVYLKHNKKIGIFLYTPSVGVGNPADWDWFIVLNK